MEELKRRMKDEVAAIGPDMIHRTVLICYDRMAYCQELGGNYSENNH